MKRFTYTLIYIWLSTLTYAQQQNWEGMIDNVGVTEAAESEVWESMFDVLSDLEEHPINLNTATREDLERLPFLTNQQIEDLQAYLYQYGNIQSMGELSMIPSLDQLRIELLSHFTYIATTDERHFPTWKELAQNGQHDLLLTAKVPFYKRQGDQNGYLGYPYRYSLRYTFNHDDYLKAGLIGAQDSGEPFLKGDNAYGFDHYSYYLVLRKLGRLKTLALGHYKIRAGLGLVVNNELGFGKSMILPSLLRSGSTIRAYSSRSSANYLQGAAATIDLGHNIDLTGFLSWRYIDGTLSKDQQAIVTFVKNGYHRTPTEMSKKNNASQTAAGIHLAWQHNGFHLGATMLYTHLSLPLQPNTAQRYRNFYPAGNHFWNASTDYGYTCRRFTFSGETAINDRHAIATIHVANVQLTSDIQLTALQRFYSYRYYTLLGQSFSDGGYTQNESGFYIGMTWHPRRNFTLTAYTDIVYFPWLRYQVSNASHAWDNSLAFSWKKKHFTFSGRYRFRTREKDDTQKTTLIDDATHRMRLSVAYTDGFWTSKTQGDFVLNHYKQSSRGWMVSQDIGCQPWKPLQLFLHGAWFHTDDYASRIYSYERGPRYDFYFPSFYGHGIRYGLLAQTNLGRSWMLLGRLSTTDYFDRDHISSGLQRINHSSMTDFELQIRWKFH